MFYVACFTEDDGIYRCDHAHATVRDAMDCLVPDGGSFIRAYDAGVFRSLNNGEFIDFLQRCPGVRAIKLKEAKSPYR